MKIQTEQDLSCKDLEITIKYAQDDRRLTRILDYLQSLDMQIRCSVEDTEQMIDIANIYYIESVDKKTFVYLEKEVYH
ncbi:MAG: LytTR family transcriptional regulator, partial [Lachnospiraceae bacterium]|nr:LytTR family transcriptional regulator [Lachnospiraceae bacterium]